MSDTKIKTSNIGNLAVTHALLHTDMDLTSKTVQVAAPSSDTHPATKLYVDTEVSNLIDSAPGTLDTLNELAAAVNDDANFAATVTSGLAGKVPLAGGTMTGDLDMGGNKVLFSNVYATEGDLPSASNNHGMFAHVHATGKGYYAHGGNWVQLANAGATGGGYSDLDTAAYLATSQNKEINGNVGIGTSSPNNLLHLKDEGYQLKLEDTSSGNTGEILVSDTSLYFFSDRSNAKANSDIRFSVDNSEKMRIDSSGNVGIGETNPAEKLEVSGNIKLDTGATQYIDLKSGTSGAKNYRIYNGISWNSDALLIYNHTDDSTILTIEPGKLGINRGASSLTQAFEVNGSAWISGNVGIGTTSPGFKLSVDNGTSDGGIFKIHNEEVGLNVSVNGGVGDYTNSTRMVVFNATRYDGGTSPKLRLGGQGGIEFAADANNVRMIIDTSGNVSVAKSSVNIGTTGHTFGASGYQHSTRNGNLIHLNQLDADGSAILFMQAGATKGSVFVNSTGTTYNTTSDRRLKDNIQPIADATDKLMDMKPVTHTWIDNPDEPQVHGFIAQEMQEVIPEAITGDAESDDMMSMDYGRITPVIVAALQDVLNEIKELKTRINELESK